MNIILPKDIPTFGVGCRESCLINQNLPVGVQLVDMGPWALCFTPLLKDYKQCCVIYEMLPADTQETRVPD